MANETAQAGTPTGGSTGPQSIGDELDALQQTLQNRPSPDEVREALSWLKDAGAATTRAAEVLTDADGGLVTSEDEEAGKALNALAQAPDRLKEALAVVEAERTGRQAEARLREIDARVQLLLGGGGDGSAEKSQD